jgi:PAS domain S-box-containing protein
MIPRRAQLWRPARWSTAFLVSLAWLMVVGLAVARSSRSDGLVVAVAGLAAVGVTFAVLARADHTRWRSPLTHAIGSVRNLRKNPRTRLSATIAREPELAALQQEIEALAKTLRSRPLMRHTEGLLSLPADPQEAQEAVASEASLTRSGLFDAPPPPPRPAYRPLTGDPSISGDYSTADMVNRLDPVSFRWIDSSMAEQIALGWTLDELQQRSFLEIVHPDDRARTRETFALALARGEALGLVVRVRTARGSSRAIEVNVGARYGTNQRVTHLRCHLTDVTDKVRAERSRRLRTLELTRVNEQLRQINRELEELKDRYSDLYENAPAMYYSLDLRGVVIECNTTMLAALNKTREEVVGHNYQNLLPVQSADGFQARFDDFLQRGSVQRETRWVKSGGEVIDVWSVGSLVAASKGSAAHARFVAQDVTTRRRLEAELREKNLRLARANAELSQRNRELDEFVYAVSHDLQEPLRTLIAFSDFLSRDYGDRLEAEGQEFVRYLVDASRRMRAMIHGMLNLARAGKVTGEHTPVNLDELVAVIKTDLGELFRSKGAELRKVGRLPVVWGDRDRIGQLLANLMSNGIKYNKSSTPWVEIKEVVEAGAGAERDGGDADPASDVTFAVTDNGIGIEPQFHATIFQLFRRLHTREEFEGTGVGLAVCNKIVQAHGGRIWVESALGDGATFYISLPGRPFSASTTPDVATANSPPVFDDDRSEGPMDELNAR